VPDIDADREQDDLSNTWVEAIENENLPGVSGGQDHKRRKEPPETINTHAIRLSENARKQKNTTYYFQSWSLPTDTIYTYMKQRKCGKFSVDVLATITIPLYTRSLS
jgi:hypothetical protein